MTDIAAPLSGTVPHSSEQQGRPKLDHPVNPLAGILFFGVIGVALLFVAYSLYVDVQESGTRVVTYVPFLLLFVALLIALGFEFVNGFHDTANAVATVIYTHSLPAHAAVVWSGLVNLMGVLVSSGASRSASFHCCRSN
jgi:inorganic phosphate transporter, PiT family